MDYKIVKNGSVLCYLPKKSTNFMKVAAFDLDGTIIKTASGLVYPKNSHDWKFTYSNIPIALKSLHETLFKIVIFSNQKGLTGQKQFDFVNKIHKITSIINCPIEWYVATEDDQFRKPCINMWKKMSQNFSLQINMDESFFVGDAAGRLPSNGKPKDFSSCDRFFAKNLNITFYTPEVYFNNEKDRPYELPNFYQVFLAPNKALLKCEPVSKSILLTGPPSSGKQTYFTNHLSSIGFKLIEDISQINEMTVIIDKDGRKNSRKIILDAARNKNISMECHYLLDSIYHCFHNNKFKRLTAKNYIIHNNKDIEYLYKAFEVPNIEEGFNQIIKVPHIMTSSDNDTSKLYNSYLIDF